MAADFRDDVAFDDSSEDLGTNPTNNRHFREVVDAHLTRRTMIKGSLAVAATSFLAPSAAYASGSKKGWWKKKGPLVDFAPATTEAVVANEGKTITVSPDYEYDVLIPWGTPIDPRSDITPYEGDPNTRPTAADQEQMIGIGHDGMWFFPINLKRLIEFSIRRGIPVPTQYLSSNFGFLCINHEFGTNSHVLGKPAPESLEDVRLSQAAHGASVVLIGRRFFSKKWNLLPSRRNRRITVNTEVAFSGPAAGSGLLDNAAGNGPAGTVNNCGSGPMPWGTYVTCEENFNGYFGYTGSFDDLPEGLQKEAFGRYGFSETGFGYGWYLFDPRFDITNPDYAGESNRFGWCLEIDPFDPHAKPVKRTAMGRFKHEAVAATTLKDGRVAVYMGDDERNDYCYKYESNRPWRHYDRPHESPLDDGKLYVAKFLEGVDGNDGKGVGEWIELTIDNPLIQAAGLTTQAEVMTYTRLAADAVGATPMDRPEWTTIGKDGQVFWTLTNNNRKPEGEPPEANPIFANNDGHVISTVDLSPTAFEWEIFILARNTRNPQNPETVVEPLDRTFSDYIEPTDGGANAFTDPDAAWADDEGRLFIGTDGGQPDGLQDQLVVFDVAKGEYRRLLSGVASDEITGITTTPDSRTMFTNTQHPGNGSPTGTNFPAPFDGVTIPRDCTIVLRRKDGGRVGS